MGIYQLINYKNKTINGEYAKTYCCFNSTNEGGVITVYRYELTKDPMSFRIVKQYKDKYLIIEGMSFKATSFITIANWIAGLYTK